MNVTIYHNPRCSKSRKALSLLEERGIEPNIVEYLVTPPSVDELRSILDLLELSPREVMRRKEAPYRELGLDDPALSSDELLQAIVEHPILLERPIVLAAGRAALGRPPENALNVL